MLSITVDLNINVVIKASCILMPSLNSAPDTQVLREIKNVEVVLATNCEGVVCRTIVNYHVVETTGANLLNCSQDGILLVVGGNDHQNAQAL